MDINNGPECNYENSIQSTTSPEGGYPPNSDGEDHNIETPTVPKTKIGTIKSRNKNIVFGGIIVVILLIGIFIYSNTLWGADRIAYDILETCSSSFKNPSSVRIISGSVFDDQFRDQKALYVNIMAENGFGATTSSYYNLYEDGKIVEIDFDLSVFQFLYDSKDDFHIKKVNKKFESLWN